MTTLAAVGFVLIMVALSGVSLVAMQRAAESRSRAEVARIQAATYRADAEQAAHRARQIVQQCRNACLRAETAAERTDPHMLTGSVWTPPEEAKP